MLEITNDNWNIAFCPVMNSFMAFMASMASTAFILCMPLQLLAFWVGQEKVLKYYKSETKVNIEIIVTFFKMKIIFKSKIVLKLPKNLKIKN